MTQCRRYYPVLYAFIARKVTMWIEFFCAFLCLLATCSFIFYISFGYCWL